MEWNAEVKSAIGEDNYNCLLEYVQKGLIKPHHMKDMAINMHGHVHGVFVENYGQDRSYVMRLMLDAWYMKVLYESSTDGFVELKKILKDIGLDVLAKNLKPKQDKLPPARPPLIATGNIKQNLFKNYSNNMFNHLNVP